MISCAVLGKAVSGHAVFVPNLDVVGLLNVYVEVLAREAWLRSPERAWHRIAQGSTDVLLHNLRARSQRQVGKRRTFQRCVEQSFQIGRGNPQVANLARNVVVDRQAAVADRLSVERQVALIRHARWTPCVPSYGSVRRACAAVVATVGSKQSDSRLSGHLPKSVAHPCGPCVGLSY